MTTKSLRVIGALSACAILSLTTALSSALGAQPGSTLTATYLGVGADVVGTYSFTPDGIADFRISLGGLRSTPTQVRVIATDTSGGVWSTPFDGAHWLVALVNQNGSSADIYIGQWPTSAFQVQVAYADGTADQANVTTQTPSTLSAVFLGAGADVVGTYSFSPDGKADFRISLGGLRATPTQIRVTATDTSGGVWSTPFDGAHWLVALANQNGSTADIYIGQWPTSTFHVQVGYGDGTTDQTDVVNQAPNPQADVMRLLEQATFGPTPSLTTSVQASGIDAFLNQQLNAPMTDYPDLPFWPQTRPATCVADCQRDNYTYYQVQRHLFANALSGQDQLRQRVAFGLSEILVTSQTDVPMPAWMRSYQQLLYRSAFGNFRQLLYDVTLHPTMGRFLDMVNNRCQKSDPVNVNICRNGLTSQPNENYAREVLQLFSLGTYLLNQDGTRQLDSGGNPKPSYDQTTIEEFARVFTGWTLAPALPSPDPSATTVPNYRDPMVQHTVTVSGKPAEDYHDRGQKTLLNGKVLTAGHTADQDLNDAIDNIAFHPNVAPFISKQLIEQLVTSNPSPAYVARIAALFTANQNSPTQLFQVAKAILLDPEARGNSIDPVSLPNYGKLREPVLFMTNILRAFNATSDGILNSPGGGIGTADMSEDLFNAPSVFNYFPPTARVPGENAVGPEFAIFSSLTSLRRANFVNQVIFSTIAPALPDRPLGTSIDLSPFDSLAANPDQLLDTLNNLLLHGSMSAAMRQNIKTAVTAVAATNPRLRVRTAVYLIATSSQYQVQR